ncbi:MAG: glycosyltransferase family 1 protein [Erysipelotrichaceae bacterium]|nr:glycosyltransferase family 1 protein [Erysipelotrichaceae bacterium]
MEEPVRVLHVVTHMNCGGLENMIMNYYRNIDRSKVQFDFLTHRPANEKKFFDDEILEMGGKIFHLPKLNPFSPYYLHSLDNFFKVHKEYKIIHVHQDCLSGIILKAAKKNNVPVRIAHCHNSNQDKGLKYFIKEYFKKDIVKYATKLYACGLQSGEWMFKTKNFEVFPNAIDAKKYQYDVKIREEMRNELDLGSSIVLGHVGRFSNVKNHKFIVDIFTKMVDMGKDAKLLLVGQGELFEEIKTIVESRQLSDRVIFTGLRSDINKIMQAMDVFLLPSLFEGFPVTMVEAQAAGLPCVISDKVPLECKITNDVAQISLNESKEVWIETIEELLTKERCDVHEEVVLKGYDVKENTKKIENYYIECVNLIKERKINKR